jgi:hypothetical protein
MGSSSHSSGSLTREEEEDKGRTEVFEERSDGCPSSWGSPDAEDEAAWASDIVWCGLPTQSSVGFKFRGFRELLVLVEQHFFPPVWRSRCGFGSIRGICPQIPGYLPSQGYDLVLDLRALALPFLRASRMD